MDYKEYSDNELCSMICENNEEAKDILFDKYKGVINIVIKKYLMASLKAGIEYNDLYQEALVGFTDAINSYDEKKDASIKTFITLCVERRLQKTILKANAMKNKFFFESLSLDYQENDKVDPLKEVISDNNKNDPLINITDDERYNELLDKINNILSNSEKEVFDLMISGLNYIEIANELGKNTKQIDNSIQRLKTKIRNILNDETK